MLAMENVGSWSATSYGRRRATQHPTMLGVRGCWIEAQGTLVA
jgi:hypothetical protein